MGGYVQGTLRKELLPDLIVELFKATALGKSYWFSISFLPNFTDPKLSTRYSTKEAANCSFRRALKTVTLGKCY